MVLYVAGKSVRCMFFIGWFCSLQTYYGGPKLFLFLFFLSSANVFGRSTKVNEGCLTGLLLSDMNMLPPLSLACLRLMLLIFLIDSSQRDQNYQI